MADERLDYAILISLSMREEAEVMASALQAEGIDSFVGNRHHANVDWGWTIALGGMQVFVPRQKVAEAKQVIRERIKEAAANPEGETVHRRDRWKAWAVIFGTIGLNAYVYWLANQEREFQKSYVEFRRAAQVAYCKDYPTDSVVLPGDFEATPCWKLNP